MKLMFPTLLLVSAETLMHVEEQLGLGPTVLELDSAREAGNWKLHAPIRATASTRLGLPVPANYRS